jgi:Metallopeptidase toxin 4
LFFFQLKALKKSRSKKMGFNIPKFNLPKFNLPNINLPKINLPRVNLPRINFPNPQQIFGTSRSSSAPQTRTAPKPNLFQRAVNFGRSFVKNPIGATVRLHQKAFNKVIQPRIEAARYIKRGTVNNFKRFENWADKGIKSNHEWSKKNVGSKNLLNRVTAMTNIGFTRLAQKGNNVINRSSDYYRGLRKSNNILVKGAGYAGGLATAIGRGLASPVTFADPRLSGKQRTGQVVDGVLSYIPVGKIVGLGGKVLKPVGGRILRFGGSIVKPIGGQISQRAPWLIKGGTRVAASSKNIARNIAASKGSQFVKNKLVTPFVNRIAKPSVRGFNNINNALNRKITFKDIRNLPQTIGNGFNKLRGAGKGVKPAVKGNPLRNINVGTRQRLANSGKLPMTTARANAGKSINNITNQVVEGNKRSGIQVYERAKVRKAARAESRGQRPNGNRNKIGNIKEDGGQILNKAELKRITKYLEKQGVEVRIDPTVKLKKNAIPKPHVYPDGRSLGYDAHAKIITRGPGKKPIMIFNNKATFNDIFHETKHLEQFKKMGPVKWFNVGKGKKVIGNADSVNTAAAETYVFNQMHKNKHLFTRKEMEDALKYVNRDRAKVELKGGARLKPLKFDYSDLPTVRPKVSDPIAEIEKARNFKK